MKTKEKKKEQKQIIILSSLIIIIGIVTCMVLLPKEIVSPTKEVGRAITAMPTSSTLQTFSSQFLQFSISVPTKFTVEDKYTYIRLKYNNSEIVIDRIGTNFTTLEDHINNLEKLNKLNIINRKKMQINNLNMIKATIQSPLSKRPDEEVYFIYPNNWSVVMISTSDSSLLDELDQIAQSFQYNP